MTNGNSERQRSSRSSTVMDTSTYPFFTFGASLPMGNTVLSLFLMAVHDRFWYIVVFFPRYVEIIGPHDKVSMDGDHFQ